MATPTRRGPSAIADTSLRMRDGDGIVSKARLTWVTWLLLLSGLDPTPPFSRARDVALVILLPWPRPRRMRPVGGPQICGRCGGPGSLSHSSLETRAGNLTTLKSPQPAEFFPRATRPQDYPLPYARRIPTQRGITQTFARPPARRSRDRTVDRSRAGCGGLTTPARDHSRCQPGRELQPREMHRGIAEPQSESFRHMKDRCVVLTRGIGKNR